MKCKMWFYTNETVSCNLLLLLCFRTIKCYISVPAVVLQVFLLEGTFKSVVMHLDIHFTAQLDCAKAKYKMWTKA